MHGLTWALTWALTWGLGLSGCDDSLGRWKWQLVRQTRGLPWNLGLSRGDNGRNDR